MTKPRNAERNRKMAMGRRSSALARNELRQPSERRTVPAGVTSFAMKDVDLETQRMVAEFLARRNAR